MAMYDLRISGPIRNETACPVVRVTGRRFRIVDAAKLTLRSSGLPDDKQPALHLFPTT